MHENAEPDEQREPGIPGRLLIVAAHPDDEVIGAGALLTRCPQAFVVHLTDGAPRDSRLRSDGGALPREQYAALRREESLAALALAGLGPDRLSCLGAVDQEAAFELSALARRLAGVLAAIRPTVVLGHAYEGGHPDHDAAAFVARAGVALLRLRGGPLPVLGELTSYHAADGVLVTGRFLHRPERAGYLLRLSADGRARKEAMIGCFRSQRAVLAPFSPVGDEQFRPAAPVDFRVPPHPGPLWYERLGWPLTGARFRELAAASLAELTSRDAPCA